MSNCAYAEDVRTSLSPKTMIIPLLSLIILFLIGYGIRVGILYRNTGTLTTTSETFPRDYYVGDKTKPPLTYLALGDSTVQGVGASSPEKTLVGQIAQRLSEKGKYVHVINAGITGARMHDVKINQLQALVDNKPDVISLVAGANDAIHHTPEADFSTSLTKVMDSLIASSAARIIIATSPDVGLMPALPHFYAQGAKRYAEKQNMVLALKITDSRIAIADLFTEGKLDPKADASLYASDQFHPSDKGYAVWGKLLAKASEQKAQH